MVVAMNNESIEQCIENIWKKKSDDHQLRWSSPKIFFPKYFEKISAKKNAKKKEQHPPFGERRSGPFLQSDDFRWKDKS